MKKEIKVDLENRIADLEATFEERGQTILLLDAARLAKRGGLTEKACKLYSWFLDGREESIPNIPKVEEEYRRRGLGYCDPKQRTRQAYEYMAEIAVEAEMYERASELHEKAGNILRAAYNAEKAGLIDRAIGLFEEKRKDFYHAAEIAVRAGMIDRAKQLYQRGFAQDREEISQVLTFVRNEEKSGHFSGDLSLEPLVCKLGLAERVPKEAGMTEIVQQMKSIEKDAYAIHRKYPYPKMFWGVP